MSRNKQTDDIYNARRRFRRQAERYEKAANRSTGVERTRYITLAQSAVEKALATYSQRTKAAQGALGRLADRLGVGTALPDTRGVQDVEELTRQSRRALASNRGRASKMSDEMAYELLNTGNIGSRFFAATREAWVREDEAYTPQNEIVPRILEFFDASSIGEVMDMLEDAGVDLYTAPENDSLYMDAVAMGMLYVQSYKAQR